MSACCGAGVFACAQPAGARSDPEDVRAYLLETLTGLLKAYPIRYLKWDMNRPLSNVGSSAWPAEEQASLSHRYVLGLYSLLQTLTARFPHLFIEGCSGGGGRFDLRHAVLCAADLDLRQQ